jgi:AraC-like DNA-binding protein
MDLLSDFGPADEVSQLLRVIRIRSTVWCRSRLGAPWGFGVQAHGHPAFHVVTAGQCWLEADGQPGQTGLEAGDLVLLPLGSQHWMRDQPATPVTALEDILATVPLGQKRLRYGGTGPATGLLCGGFAVEGGTAHPILRALPQVVVIRGTRGRPVAWLSATLDMLRAEMDGDAPGAHEMVTRLADVLLTQALRAALTQLQSPNGAGLLALRDRQIAAAIRIIHARPEHAWTVGELAGRVALSRSAFSARFRALVGESPLRYVTRTRLAHAAALLRTTDASLAQIAARAGYGTEFSFGKAFKRAFGIAPGAYRGQPTPPGAVR